MYCCSFAALLQSLSYPDCNVASAKRAVGFAPSHPPSRRNSAVGLPATLCMRLRCRAYHIEDITASSSVHVVTAA